MFNDSKCINKYLNEKARFVSISTGLNCGKGSLYYREFGDFVITYCVAGSWERGAWGGERRAQGTEHRAQGTENFCSQLHAPCSLLLADSGYPR
jgi:hypothetical protein